MMRYVIYISCVTFVVVLPMIRTTSNSSIANILYLKDASNIWNSQENIEESFTIRTSGCVIPDLHFLDASVHKFIHYPTSIKNCPNSKHPLLANNQSHIWIVKEHIGYYKIANKTALECGYRAFSQAPSHKKYKNASTAKYLHRKYFNETIIVHDEFVAVDCYYKHNIIYKQLFAFTPKKPFTYHRQKPFETSHDQCAYNVIMIGMTSISRLNFHRTMPNTLKYLKEKEAVELLGYSSVGRTTHRNLMAILVGMNKSELINTCWPSAHSSFDSCSFIWERFKDVGYYTGFAENSNSFGIFKSYKFSFKGRPTDYYLHPFIRESGIRKKKNNPSSSSCMGTKRYYKLLLDYAESLTSTLNSSNLFSLFWESSMSSQNLNFPMIMDHDYENFIRKLNDNGYLNKTFVFLFSDYGLRSGNITFTKQGQLEERLPFMYILAPPQFREKYSLAYENIKTNSHRLTTPFDVHKTLIDLIDLDAIKNEDLLFRSREMYSDERGISLFLPIPSNRTCKMADISDDLCACHERMNISVDSKIAQRAATFLVHSINELLKSYSECVQLSLEKVITINEMTPRNYNGSEWRDFVVAIQTEPGGGEYEAVLRYHYKWHLASPVTRRNPKREQTLCIRDHQLMRYCYCRLL